MRRSQKGRTIRRKSSSLRRKTQSSRRKYRRSQGRRKNTKRRSRRINKKSIPKRMRSKSSRRRRRSRNRKRIGGAPPAPAPKLTEMLWTAMDANTMQRVSQAIDNKLPGHKAAVLKAIIDENVFAADSLAGQFLAVEARTATGAAAATGGILIPGSSGSAGSPGSSTPVNPEWTTKVLDVLKDPNCVGKMYIVQLGIIPLRKAPMYVLSNVNTDNEFDCVTLNSSELHEKTQIHHFEALKVSQTTIKSLELVPSADITKSMGDISGETTQDLRLFRAVYTVGVTLGCNDRYMRVAETQTSTFIRSISDGIIQLLPGCRFFLEGFSTVETVVGKDAGGADIKATLDNAAWTGLVGNWAADKRTGATHQLYEATQTTGIAPGVALMERMGWHELTSMFLEERPVNDIKDAGNFLVIKPPDAVVHRAAIVMDVGDFESMPARDFLPYSNPAIESYNKHRDSTTAFSIPSLRISLDKPMDGQLKIYNVGATAALKASTLLSDLAKTNNLELQIPLPLLDHCKNRRKVFDVMRSSELHTAAKPIADRGVATSPGHDDLRKDMMKLKFTYSRHKFKQWIKFMQLEIEGKVQLDAIADQMSNSIRCYPTGTIGPDGEVHDYFTGLGDDGTANAVPAQDRLTLLATSGGIGNRVEYGGNGAPGAGSCLGIQVFTDTAAKLIEYCAQCDKEVRGTLELGLALASTDQWCAISMIDLDAGAQAGHPRCGFIPVLPSACLDRRGRNPDDLEKHSIVNQCGYTLKGLRPTETETALARAGDGGDQLAQLLDVALGTIDFAADSGTKVAWNDLGTTPGSAVPENVGRRYSIHDHGEDALAYLETELKLLTEFSAEAGLGIAGSSANFVTEARRLAATDPYGTAAAATFVDESLHGGILDTFRDNSVRTGYPLPLASLTLISP